MNFEDIEVWRRAARLSAELYVAMRDCKDFGFRDQITRAGLSIASNIAEGCERNSDKDFARFLKIAKGSCGELRTQIYIGMEADYIDSASGKQWIRECREINRMLHGFIGTLTETN